jgi:hypothetical protein
MGFVRAFSLAAALAAVSSTGGFAQGFDRELSAPQMAVACASPTSPDLPDNGLRVTGAQDTVGRTVFGERDLLILNAGTNGGVQVDQEYYIRRPVYFGSPGRNNVQSITTAGWVRVVSVNESMAIASVEHFCGAIMAGDYLESFVAPTLPAMPERELAFDELDFQSLGRVLGGMENHSSGGAGDLMTIDRGSVQGVTPGARFAIYRDLHMDGVPLSSIGEGVVLTTGQSTSVARIIRSRDAVVTGDYVVPRK